MPCRGGLLTIQPDEAVGYAENWLGNSVFQIILYLVLLFYNDELW